MKKGAVILLLIVFLMSCAEREVISEFTGNEITYPLPSASAYPVTGSVTLKEKRDGSTLVMVALSGTDGTAKLPVHLHLGDISVDGAEVAALLQPVDATTGLSETPLRLLANENPVTYQELLTLEANIKVHLSDTGPEKDVILAGGNIGKLFAAEIKNGRVTFGVCKSN